MPSSLDLLGPCVSWPEGGTAYIEFDYQGSGGTVPGSISYHLRPFSDPSCTTSAGAGIGLETFEVFPWAHFEGNLVVPAGGSVRLQVEGGCDGTCLADLDRIRLTREPYVFFGDFEGGGTCHWTGASK